MAEPYQFTPDTNIEEALQKDERVGPALRSLGLKCFDSRGDWCVAASVETFREAALYHNVSLERILEVLHGLGPLTPPGAPAGGASA